jgi:ComF family protein
VSGKKFFNYLLEFLFPRVCFSCGHDIDSDFANPLCRICYEKLDFIGDFYCRLCGRKIDSGGICYWCARTPKPNFLFLRSVFMYNDEISSLITAYKYRNYKYLYKWFANIMSISFLRYREFFEYNSITYIPLSKGKMRKRGYNQTELIAREVSMKLKLNFLKDVAVKIKETKNQVELNREERMLNLRDAFMVIDKERVRGRSIIVVDDVATTMSTLNEFSKALKESGAKKISCFTIARE